MILLDNSEDIELQVETSGTTNTDKETEAVKITRSNDVFILDPPINDVATVNVGQTIVGNNVKITFAPLILTFFDTVRPQFVEPPIVNGTNKIELVFDEPLKSSSFNIGDFNLVTKGLDNEISNIDVSGSKLIMTVANTVSDISNIDFTYTAGRTSSTASDKFIRDQVDNSCNSFTYKPITRTPKFVSGSVTSDNSGIRLVMSENVNLKTLSVDDFELSSKWPRELITCVSTSGD